MRQLINKLFVPTLQSNSIARRYGFANSFIFTLLVFIAGQLISIPASAGDYVWTFTTGDFTPPVQSAWNPAKSALISTAAPTILFHTNENADCKWSLTDDAYGAMANDCSGDGTMSQSCITAGLIEGAEIVYVACRDAALNADTIITNTHVNYIVDTTLPVQSAWNPASGTTLTSASQA
ncbi:MAG: hypothetical protein WCX65_19210, partial [bacterium]